MFENTVYRRVRHRVDAFERFVGVGVTPDASRISRMRKMKVVRWRYFILMAFSDDLHVIFLAGRTICYRPGGTTRR
jgi:hypothetical protein